MLRSLTKKSLMLLIIFPLNSCAPSQQVACHDWTIQEKQLLKDSDRRLSPDDELHDLIRDYERVCANIG